MMLMEKTGNTPISLNKQSNHPANNDNPILMKNIFQVVVMIIISPIFLNPYLEVHVPLVAGAARLNTVARIIILNFI